MTQALLEPRKNSRKAKGDGHLRRAEILQAAERLFLAEGYEGATIRKIADHVGVSSTALYMHFRDKDEILLEICTAAMEHILEVNCEIAAQPIDPVERARMMLKAYVRFAVENPSAYSMIFCSSPLAASLEKREATLDLGTQCFMCFAGVMREIAASGRLRTGDVDAAHQALWAACHGMVALRFCKPDFPWAEPDMLTDVLLDGMFYGLIAD